MVPSRISAGEGSISAYGLLINLVIYINVFISEPIGSHSLPFKLYAPFQSQFVWLDRISHGPKLAVFELYWLKIAKRGKTAAALVGAGMGLLLGKRG